MFSAIYFNIALLYLLVFVVLFLSLYAVLQLPLGLHEEQTVYQWIRRVWSKIKIPKVGLAQSMRGEIFQIKDARATRTKSL